MLFSFTPSILLFTSLLSLSSTVLAARNPSISHAPKSTTSTSSTCAATTPYTSTYTTQYYTTYTTTYTTVLTNTTSSFTSTSYTVTGSASRYCPTTPSTVTYQPTSTCTFNTATCIRPQCILLSTTTVCDDPCCSLSTVTVLGQASCHTKCDLGCATTYMTVTTCAPPQTTSTF